MRAQGHPLSLPSLPLFSPHPLLFFSPQPRTNLQARALVLSGAADLPETYNSVMNAIFSAQKAGVLVDCVVLGESSTFLQQAAYLTSEDIDFVFCYNALRSSTHLR